MNYTYTLPGPYSSFSSSQFVAVDGTATFISCLILRLLTSEVYLYKNIFSRFSTSKVKLIYNKVYFGEMIHVFQISRP